MNIKYNQIHNKKYKKFNAERMLFNSSLYYTSYKISYYIIKKSH